MIRITGGQFRSRWIETPSGNQTRPTQNRVRQALFNSLQIWIQEKNQEDESAPRVLDAFAGSGALGFEALSRGAAFVCFVDQAPEPVQVIQKNRETLQVKAQSELVRADVVTFTRSVSDPFDLVLADPPYAWGGLVDWFTTTPWRSVLKPGGKVVLELGDFKQLDHGQLIHPALDLVREKDYGDTILKTFELKGEESS